MGTHRAPVPLDQEGSEHHQFVHAGGAMAHSHGHEYEPDHEHDEGHDELQHCIEECLNCHAVCTMTAQYCLTEGGEDAGRHSIGGVLAGVNLIGVLLACAEICQVSANFMLRGSPHHVVTCMACAELCRACEEA